jgi:glycosyltransferase involved in cell wall biosynthesis
VMLSALAAAPATTATDTLPLRTVVAHDWLISYHGSERVVEELLSMFSPTPRLLTTLVEKSALPKTLSHAEPSFLQLMRPLRRHHGWLLPAMPLSWRMRRSITDVDLIVSSSHACAKAVRGDAGIPHLCYCHTPMRYAWDFDAESSRFPRPVRGVARIAMSGFRRWDQETASHVTQFVANSNAVARRIEDAYHRDAVVVHPPVRTDFFMPSDRKDDFFLWVGRLAGYKRPDLVMDAFARLPYRLIVVGDGPLRARLESRATANVSFVGAVDLFELRRLYAEALALVFPVEEDFGIAMAEAQASGTPVVALSRGGALDIVTPGVTGIFVSEQDVRSVVDAVEEVARTTWSSSRIAASAQRFSPLRFRSGVRAVVSTLVQGS